MFSADFLGQLAVQLVIVVGTIAAQYAAIRADLASLHRRVDAVEDDVDAESKRMDNHLDRTTR